MSITVEQCVPGTRVWYEPSDGARFLCEISSPAAYVMGYCYTRSLKLVAKHAYAAFKGRRGNFYDTVALVPLGSLYPVDLPATVASECIADELCTSCSTFVCPGCNSLRPACCGASDDDPELCNECVYVKHGTPLDVPDANA